MRPAYALVVLSFVLGACDRPIEAGDADVTDAVAANAAARGLPQSLLPSDFGTPQYDPPRNRCAPMLRDDARPGVQLTLERQGMRIDWSREGSGMRSTTTTSRVPEGEYRVSPDTAYGLTPGQLLRVDCARQRATTVVEPARVQGGDGT